MVVKLLSITSPSKAFQDLTKFAKILLLGRLCAILYIKDFQSCPDPSEVVVTATASFLYMYRRLRLDRYRVFIGSGLVIICGS